MSFALHCHEVNGVKIFLVWCSLIPLSRLRLSDFWSQRVFAVAEDGAVAGPGVFVEFFEILHQFCSQGIEVDVANQLQKIRIFFADNGFVSILEEMATSLMTFIEGDGVTGHKPAHDFT